MATMLREVTEDGRGRAINLDALKSEIRGVLINQKANACPIACRLAWHASGTWSEQEGNGGCNGARMRFAPEATDDANAGLSIVRDLLLPIKLAHPEVSYADLWAVAGCAAIEFLGGPKIPVRFGRTDEPAGRHCPIAPGRLPDAALGANHLREVFGKRMGFSDRDIVALSGAHTLGRAHAVRSGYDGPWTSKPLSFDNEYFKVLLNRTWVKRKWDGPIQYEDEETGDLMMLPTDLCLIQDAAFKKWVEVYAHDEKEFFADFASAFSRLIALGCPPHVQPDGPAVSRPSAVDAASALFREHAMHGSLDACKKALAQGAEVNQVEATSGRTALHKAAFWGHIAMTKWLLEVKVNPNIQDVYGDSALHDAAKFGHTEVVKALVAGGANVALRNAQGQTAHDLARLHEKADIVQLLGARL